MFVLAVGFPRCRLLVEIADEVVELGTDPWLSAEPPAGEKEPQARVAAWKQRKVALGRGRWSAGEAEPSCDS